MAIIRNFENYIEKQRILQQRLKAMKEIQIMRENARKESEQEKFEKTIELTPEEKQLLKHREQRIQDQRKKQKEMYDKLYKGFNMVFGVKHVHRHSRSRRRK